MTSLPPSDRVLASHHAIRPRNLALGIERIGFFSLSHRTLVSLAFIVLSAIAAVGFARVKVDDSLSQLFRSDTDEFRTYEEVTRRFPSNEFDVLIVIEGDRLLERSSLRKLRDLAIESPADRRHQRPDLDIFGARTCRKWTDPASLLPRSHCRRAAEYQSLLNRVMSNEIIHDKMLSPDGKLTLMVLALEPAAIGPDSLNKIVDEVRNEVKTEFGGHRP